MSEHQQTAAQMLFEARTSGRRKREIATISKLLCIREEYLLALEKGQYKQIPEVVYILGFARNYAMELGLDPDEIVGKIKKELGIVDECDTSLADEHNDVKEEVIVAAAAPVKKKSAAAKNSFFSKASKVLYKHWKLVLTGIIALAVIIGAVAVIFSLGDKGQGTDSTNAPVVVVAEPEYKTEVREKFGTENRANTRVILQANAETWVKIEDARGNTVFSRVLVPGDVYYVPDGDKYKGTFGNAAGVDVWVDGTLTQKLGAAHTRKTGVLMTPEALTGAPEAPTTLTTPE